VNAINRISGTAFGLHLADQIAIVSVPLAAALVFNASPEMIGLLIACQSLAHLLGSLPFGILVDRSPLRSLIIAATMISAIGFSGITVSLYFAHLVSFAVFVTVSGFGIVLFTLTALSIIPLLTNTKGLSKGNATIEIPRTFSSFFVPLTVAAAITVGNVNAIFLCAALATYVAILLAIGLPKFERAKSNSPGIFLGLFEGAKFVANSHYLRAISICAIFWNLAFTALLVVVVPLLTDYYAAEPSAFGVALAAFGLGAIGGTWLARQIGGTVAPNILLIFGPATSALAAIGLYFGPQLGSIYVVYAAFLLLGFGPSMWLITQNTVRQLVTPSEKLGRVNAVIQTAIYGMRPLGALIGGFIVGATSPQTGLLVVAIAFALSCAVSIFSRLIRITTYENLSASMQN